MMMFIRYHMILGLASSYPIWYFLENDVHANKYVCRYNWTMRWIYDSSQIVR